MALKHDAQGFLLGDPVDVTDQVDLWKDIQSDVAAIRRLLSRMARPAGEVGASVKPPSELIKPGRENRAIEVGVRVDVRSGRGGEGGAGGPGGNGDAGGLGGLSDTGNGGSTGAREHRLRDEKNRFASPSSRRIPTPEPRHESGQEMSSLPAAVGEEGLAATPEAKSFAAIVQPAAASANSTATLTALPPETSVSPAPAKVAEPAGRHSATLVARNAGGRFVGRAADAGNSNDPGEIDEDRPRPDVRKPASPSGRDSRGRFTAVVAAKRASPALPDRDSGREKSNDAGLPHSLTERVVEAAQEAGSGASEAGKTPIGNAALPSGRDSRGRFSAGSRSGRDGDGAASRGRGRDGDDGSSVLLSSFARRVVNAAREAGSGAGDAEPAIRAFSEVAQPMMRGYQVLVGSDRSKRQEGWLRRISASLTGFRREEGMFAKTATKSLKEIEEKPANEGGSGGGGILSMLFGFFAKLPLLGMALTGIVAVLSKAIGFISNASGGLFGKAAGAIGAAGLGASRAGKKASNEVAPATAAGQAAGSAPNSSAGKPAGSPGTTAAKGGILGKAGGAAAKFGKRIPVLGALLALGMGASEASATENEDSLTREQKNVEHGKAAGGVVGGLSGAAAGAVIGSVIPVVGTVIGGILGAVLGEWLGREGGRVVGENLVRISETADAVWQSVKDSASHVWESIRSNASSAWESIKTGSSSIWEMMSSGWAVSMGRLGEFVDSAKADWDRIASLFQSAYEGMKSIPVIGGAIKAAEGLAKKAVAQVAPVAAAAKEKAAEVGLNVTQAAKSAASSAAPALVAAKDKAVEVGHSATQAVKAVAAEAAPIVVAARDGAIEIGSKAASGVRRGVSGASAAVERAYNVTAATAGSALETVMPNGYRHKALFDGIKGGDSLTKYGSYTDEEAAKIRELKTSGANTSANIKSGMSREVQDKISAQAKKAGLDPVMMQKIAAMESGGNANAISSTGAVGIYQFVGNTASGVGIKNRFDMDQNIEGGMRLTRQNQEALKKAGLPITAENLYMMHQLGPGAAKEVIRGAAVGKSKEEMSPETQKAMNLNYGSNSKTAADYIATNKMALEDRYALVTNDGIGPKKAVAKTHYSTDAVVSAASGAAAAQAHAIQAIASTDPTVGRSDRSATPQMGSASATASAGLVGMPLDRTARMLPATGADPSAARAGIGAVSASHDTSLAEAANAPKPMVISSASGVVPAASESLGVTSRIAATAQPVAKSIAPSAANGGAASFSLLDRILSVASGSEAVAQIEVSRGSFGKELAGDLLGASIKPPEVAASRIGAFESQAVTPSITRTTAGTATNVAASSPAFSPPRLPAALASPVMASVQIPSIPVMSRPIQIPEAPPVVVSAASSAPVSRQMTQQAPAREVGQDVADRRIAHIVTGGLA